MSFFKSLFATPEMVKDAFTAVTNGVDSAFFTTEESVKAWLEYLKATQPQNLARRFIALIVTGTWAYFCIVTTVAVFFASDEITGKLIEFGSVYMMPPFTILISWYVWKGVKEKK